MIGRLNVNVLGDVRGCVVATTSRWTARSMPGMPIRVALLAAECEPWAKTGGLADVVDALARALGRLPEAGDELLAPVDVFLPRSRAIGVPPAAEREPAITVQDPRGGAPLDAGIVNVAADG